MRIYALRVVVLQVMVIAFLAGPALPASAVPINDNFADAQEIVGTSATVTGSNVDATAEPGEPNHAGGGSGTSIWYRWTAPEDASMRIDVCDSDFDTVLAVYTGTDVASLTEVASNDDADACAGFFTSRVTIAATAATTYHIAVDGGFDETGAVVLTLTDLRPPNDDFAAADALSGFVARGTADSRFATLEDGEPDPFGGRLGHSVWFRWTAPGSGVVTVDTCRSNFNTLLGVFAGADLASLTEIAANDDRCGRQSRIVLYAPRGTTLYVQVAGADASGRVTLRITMPRTGSYRGRTEFVDGKPIRFNLAANGRVVRDFTFSQTLECYYRRRYLGDFKLKDLSIAKIEVGRDADGAAFAANVRVRLRGGGGGRLIIEIRGELIPPERAAGRLEARVELNNGVRCKNVWKSVRWKARRR